MKDENMKKILSLTEKSEIKMKVHDHTCTYRFSGHPEKDGFELYVVENNKIRENRVYGLSCMDMDDVVLTLMQDYRDGIIEEVDYVKALEQEKDKNEVYLKGYFYFKTNANSVEEAMEELEGLGLNMDNVNEIELRDSEGNTLDTLEDKER